MGRGRKRLQDQSQIIQLALGVGARVCLQWLRGVPCCALCEFSPGSAGLVFFVVECCRGFPCVVRFELAAEAVFHALAWKYQIPDEMFQVLRSMFELRNRFCK